MKLPKGVKDRTGDRYGLLIAREFLGIENRKAVWWFDCDCGEGRRLESTQMGYVKSCGCDRYSSNRRDFAPRYYRNYIKAAVQRDIEWDLTFEQFMDLIYLPCHFCGREPYRTPVNHLKSANPDFVVGLDRYDNDLGYEMDNVVPCCSECNLAKGTMTAKAFVNMCRLICRNKENWL